MIKRKQWRELITFTLLLAIALFLAVGKKAGIRTPVSLLGQILNPIGKMLLK